MTRSAGDYVRDFFKNWRDSEASLGRRSWMMLRNRAKAYGTLKGCCGHRGEPGC